MVRKSQDLWLYLKLIMPLFLPVLIEQYFIGFISGLNTIMVSRLGSEQMSAIGSVSTLTNTVNAVFIALNIAGTVLGAQYLGRGQVKRLNQGAALGILTALIFSLAVGSGLFVFRRTIIWQLFGAADPVVLNYAVEYLAILAVYLVPLAVTGMAFGFMRGVGDVRTPMRISIMVNLLSLILNYFLIYGLQFSLAGQMLGWPGYGLRGSAAAYLIAQSVGMVLALVSLIRGAGPLKLDSPALLKPDKTILGSLFRISLPTGAEQLVFYIGLIIIQTFIVTFSTAQVAGNSIAGSLTFLIAAPGLALATITSTVVGQAVGEGDKEKARSSLRHINRLGAVSYAVMALIFLPTSRFFLGLYSGDTAAVDAAVPLITLWLVISIFTWPPSFIIPNALRASGDVRYSAFISVLSIILQVALAWLFGIRLGLGIFGIWLAMAGNYLLRAVLYTKRSAGEHWLQQRSLD